MRLVLHSISAVSTAFSASSCEGSPHKMFRMKQRLANAIMDEQDPAREPRLLLVSYYLASPPPAPIMSNAADLHNELSRVAPSYQHNDNRQAVAVVTIISCGCCSLNVLPVSYTHLTLPTILLV